MYAGGIPKAVLKCGFEDLLDSLPLVIFLKDTDRRVTWCNRRFAKVSGIKREDLIGQVIHPNLTKDHMDIAIQTDLDILNGAQSRTYDQHMLCPCGDIIDIRFLKVPAINADGEIVGIIGIGTDRTHDQNTVRDLTRSLNSLQTENSSLHRHAQDLQTSLAFTEDQASQVIDLAEQIEIQRLNIEEQNTYIKRLMHTDETTGIHNRRYFFDHVTEILDSRQAHAEKGVLAILDIDLFKRINDSHGHAAGDEALRCTVNAIRDKLPLCSLFCRYGGEEFVVITPGMSHDNGLMAIDKIRSAVAETVCAFKGTPIRLTLSAGVTNIKPSEHLDDMLVTADKALYQAKHNGRNCVVFAETP